MHHTHRLRHAFTLIEMSVVLVIVGLLAGGILVGRDLIRAAVVRAQITQINKYNVAVNTFQHKYDALPGDMPPSIATASGFTVGLYCDGTSMGKRDGNGLIDGWAYAPLLQAAGETELFWQDLSSPVAGNLIDGIFPSAGAPAFNCGANGSGAVAGTTVGQYFPPAKIGRSNYIYVYEYSGVNWYGVSNVTSTSIGGNMLSNPAITVQEAYNIDKKIDDGLPASGNVQAAYLNNNIFVNVSVPILAPNTTTSGGNSTSCYDTTTNTYSTTIQGGNLANCAISFVFQ